jgi:beta-glucosidase
MRSLTPLYFASLAAGAAIEQRDPVPKGYVAAPYYPCKLSVHISFKRELRRL